MRRTSLTGIVVTQCAFLALVGCTVNNNAVNPDAGPTGDAGTTDSAPQGDSGPRTLAFTPSNIDLSGLDLSMVGDIDATMNCSFNSDMKQQLCGDNALVVFKTMTLANSTKVGVYVARSFRVEPNAVVTIDGNAPIVFVALDKIEILGGIVGAAKGYDAVAGGFTQATHDTNGGGAGGGLAGNSMNAAGGGSFCGIGGAGASESAAPGSAGGPAYGTPELAPLVGGSSGGAASGSAGAGGGAIQLVASNAITIPAGGFLHVGGGGGSFGGAAGTQEASGGGSGGAILLEATTVTVAGILATNGGGGGEGALGNGGADATATDQPAGGGGGGAGRIRINTKTGAATLAGAKLSPPASTTCATQGTLRP